MEKVKADKFGTFPHPRGPVEKLDPPILFLVASPGTYQKQYNTYLHFFNFAGGCTGHYREKHEAACYFLEDKDVGKYISDMNMIAGDMDLLIRSQLPEGKEPDCIEELADRVEKSVNEWLVFECEEKKRKFIQIKLCQLENIKNPLKIKTVHYDWGIRSEESGNEKSSYYFTNIRLREKIDDMWFLGEKSETALREALLKNREFMKTRFYEMVSNGVLHPIYISPRFSRSLLVHNWIEFRDSSVDDLIRALEKPEKLDMDKRISTVRDLLFRILETEKGDAFVSFFVPDLESLYKLLDVTHNIVEFHRIRTRIVTHSILLRPPFLQEVVENE